MRKMCKIVSEYLENFLRNSYDHLSIVLKDVQNLFNRQLFHSSGLLKSLLNWLLSHFTRVGCDHARKY
jgi:hypothetical protein